MSKRPLGELILFLSQGRFSVSMICEMFALNFLWTQYRAVSYSKAVFKNGNELY